MFDFVLVFVVIVAISLSCFHERNQIADDLSNLKERKIKCFLLYGLPMILCVVGLSLILLDMDRFFNLFTVMCFLAVILKRHVCKKGERDIKPKTLFVSAGLTVLVLVVMNVLLFGVLG